VGCPIQVNDLFDIGFWVRFRVPGSISVRLARSFGFPFEFPLHSMKFQLDFRRGICNLYIFSSPSGCLCVGVRGCLFVCVLVGVWPLFRRPSHTHTQLLTPTADDSCFAPTLTSTFTSTPTVSIRVCLFVDLA